MPDAPAALREAPGRSAEVEDAPVVRELLAHDVQINAAWTRTQPPFIMTFTDPRHDIDVSRAMASTRTVEALYNLYWCTSKRSHGVAFDSTLT